jgi:hypothetical protein
MASTLFCSFWEAMAGLGSIAKIPVSSANVAVVMSGGGRMEGRRYRGGKVKNQGHYLGGLLHELEAGLSIRCQL